MSLSIKLILLRWLLISTAVSSLLSCAHSSQKWYVDKELNGLGKASKSAQKQYRVLLEPGDTKNQKDWSRQQLLVIHRWTDGGFSFAGLSPLGMKLYDGNRNNKDLTFNKNPLNSDVDFLLLTQVIVYLEYQFELDTVKRSGRADETSLPLPFPGISTLQLNECEQLWCARFQLDRDELSVGVISLQNENNQ